MKSGWFVGDFSPAAYRTNKFEVALIKHTKGQKWPTHIHKEATEINLLLKGSMIIQDCMIEAGMVFVIEPWEIADPVFLEDCELIVIKTPSIIGDKYEYIEKTV